MTIASTDARYDIGDTVAFTRCGVRWRGTVVGVEHIPLGARMRRSGHWYTVQTANGSFPAHESVVRALESAAVPIPNGVAWGEQ